MNLLQVAEKIEGLDDDAVVCARKPWTSDSEARLVSADAQGALPEEVRAAGFKYFLEVHVGKEVLEVFRGRSEPTERKLALLVYYAENDAYPDWVYED